MSGVPSSGHSITSGDNAWPGGGVVVRPGVTIGITTAVGAGDVVTRSIPDHVVRGGQRRHTDPRPVTPLPLVFAKVIRPERDAVKAPEQINVTSAQSRPEIQVRDRNLSDKPPETYL
jgi:hypothetical protein